MPHLQDAMADQKLPERNGAGTVNGLNSSLSCAEDLQIQLAKPNVLASSDPVVAMAKNVAATVVESSFESTENDSSHSLSSPPPRQIIKNVITPSSSVGQVIPVSTSASTSENSGSESESSSSRTPGSTALYGNSHLAYSPMLVKRRVSQSEDDEGPIVLKKVPTKESTVAREGNGSSASEHGRPALIRRGSSLSLGKRPLDNNFEADDRLPSTSKIKISHKKAIFLGESSNAADIEVVAASAMAGMRKEKPDVSPPSTSQIKLEEPHKIQRQQQAISSHNSRVPTQSFPQGKIALPTFHPHMAQFGGYPFPTSGHHPMLFPGYPPHVPPLPMPPLMVGPFHPHPGHGFYPYHSGFHHHAMNNFPGQPSPPFLSHPGQASNRLFPGGQKQICTTKPFIDSEIDQDMKSESRKTSEDEKSVSIKRCIPLKDPVPSKHCGKTDLTKNVVLPDFHRLVNYPAYLSKSRSITSGDSKGKSKVMAGQKHCVMCGELRACSVSSLMEKGRTPIVPIISEDGTAHIIPRQNKGLCTACDVTVWMVVDSGLQIKWCKGCKNFRQWAAFGEKGSATKCVRCRERQREKYAMQKDAKRARQTTKARTTIKDDGKATPSTVVAASTSSRSQHSGLVGEKVEKHFSAASGLTSLMNAAASL